MVEFSLRPYQLIALEALHAAIQAQDILLLQAATGSGKTVMLVRKIMRYYHEHPDRTFLVVMHKKELVEQFLKSFLKFSTIPAADIGIVCAGVKKEAQLDRRVTIASVQTLINKTDTYAGADLVVVDETHRVGHDDESQYQKLLQTLREYKPNHKVIGVTATAYRLGHGMIYGERCRPGRTNFFPELTHRVTYKELVANSYLMKLKGQIASHEQITVDLAGVKVSGDYNLGQAGSVMSQGRHINSAVDGYEEYGLHHDHVCVFACTIGHAEALCATFNYRGHEAVVIHSRLTPVERQANLARWQSGKVKIAVSINILIEGFDFPALSCLIFCRPTLSPTLYVQAIGRILRIDAGKEEALVIDLTDNTRQFGTDLDNPVFAIPKAKDGEGEAPMKVCPGELPDGQLCGTPIHASLKFCPECGHEFDDVDIKPPGKLGAMEEVTFSEPETYKVNEVEYLAYQSQKTGRWLVRVKYSCGSSYHPKGFSDWLCLPDYYDGYAVTKAKTWWEERSDEPFPDTVEEALFMAESLNVPEQIQVVREGRYDRVVGYEYEDSDDYVLPESEELSPLDILNDDVPF